MAYGLLNFGIKDSDDPSRIFLIKVLNALALAAILVPIAGLALIDLALDNALAISTLYVIIGLVSIYANSIRQFDFSKILLVLVLPSLQCIYILSYNSVNNGAELTILPFIMLAPFIHDDIKKGLACTTYVALLFGACLTAQGYFRSEGLVFNAVVVFIGILIGAVILINHLRSSAQELADKNKILQEKNEHLKVLVNQNRLKSDLLAILSHDLKGPVLSFNMLSDKVAFLLRNNDHDTLLAMADSFEDSSRQLFKNIDNMLNWSISQRDTIKTYFRVLPIRSLIEDTLVSFDYLLRKRKIEIDLQIGYETMLTSDEHILTIILKNVIDNAIKYSPDRSRIVISYSQDKYGDYISILDHGQGIEEEVVRHLNSGVHEKSIDGFGLGLKISLDLIKSLRGGILFERGAIVGTQVTLALRKESPIEDDIHQVELAIEESLDSYELEYIEAIQGH